MSPGAGGHLHVVPTELPGQAAHLLKSAVEGGIHCDVPLCRTVHQLPDRFIVLQLTSSVVPSTDRVSSCSDGLAESRLLCSGGRFAQLRS